MVLVFIPFTPISPQSGIHSGLYQECLRRAGSAPNRGRLSELA